MKRISCWFRCLQRAALGRAGRASGRVVFAAGVGVLALSGTASAAPDLLPIPPITIPSEIAAGFSTNVEYTVANFGDFSSGAFRTGLYLSPDASCLMNDTLVGSAAHGSLGSFNVTTVQTPIVVPSAWTSGPNDHLCIIVDDLNQVIEGQESNNNYTTPISIVECVATGQCDDGLYCNGSESCVANACVAGPPVDCSDGVSCTVDQCDEALDQCASMPDDAACDDHLYCTGVESCDPVLDCQPGQPPSCDDGVTCTVDACNPGSDACENLPDDLSCADGIFCNGDEVCDVVLDCQPGPLRSCDDGLSCTIDSCNVALDVCEYVPDHASCDDGIFCNGAEVCDLVAGCEAGPGPCADNLYCTVEVCDELTQSCTQTGPSPTCGEPVELVYADPTGRNAENFGASVAINDRHVLIGIPDVQYAGAVQTHRLLPSGPTSGTLEFIPFPYTVDAITTSFALSGDSAFVSIDAGASSGWMYQMDFDGSAWGPFTFLYSDPHTGRVVATGDDLRVTGLTDGLVDRFDPALGAWAFNGYLIAYPQIPLPAVAADASGSRVVLSAIGGAAVFQWDGSGWPLEGFLWGAFPSVDGFGHSVGLDGSVAVVGAPEDDVVAADGGAVYVFEYDGSSWVLVETLTVPPDEVSPGDRFGWSLALDGDRLIVGSPGDDDAGIDSGSAYLFERVGGSFGQTAKLVSPAGVAGQQFGIAVAQANGLVVVGASPAAVLASASASSGGAPVAGAGAVAAASTAGSGAAWLFGLPQPVSVPSVSPSGLLVLGILLIVGAVETIRRRTLGSG